MAQNTKDSCNKYSYRLIGHSPKHHYLFRTLDGTDFEITYLENVLDRKWRTTGRPPDDLLHFDSIADVYDFLIQDDPPKAAILLQIV